MSDTETFVPVTTPGSPVTYLGREAVEYDAMVISPDKGDGRVSLVILRPSGRTYVHHDVPMAGSAEFDALVAARTMYDAEQAVKAAEVAPDSDEDPFAEPADFSYTPKPVVRSWKPRLIAA